MVNYINHDSKNPNVKVKWPEKELIAHKPEWLKKDPDFLRNTIEKIGLSFEYVALMDIKEGDEVSEHVLALQSRRVLLSRATQGWLNGCIIAIFFWETADHGLRQRVGGRME
jgi:hypothetical protein